MRIKSLAQGENILMLGIEPSTFVSKVDILTTTPIVQKLWAFRSNKNLYSRFFLSATKWQFMACMCGSICVVLRGTFPSMDSKLADPKLPQSMDASWKYSIRSSQPNLGFNFRSHTNFQLPSPDLQATEDSLLRLDHEILSYSSLISIWYALGKLEMSEWICGVHINLSTENDVHRAIKWKLIKHGQCGLQRRPG